MIWSSKKVCEGSFVEAFHVYSVIVFWSQIWQRHRYKVLESMALQRRMWSDGFAFASLNSQQGKITVVKAIKRDTHSPWAGTMCTQEGKSQFGYFDCHALQLTFKGRDKVVLCQAKTSWRLRINTGIKWIWLQKMQFKIRLLGNKC